MKTLAELKDVRCWFRVRESIRTTATVKAVDGVSMEVRPNEVVGVVGESGSGKSTVGRLLLKLVPPTEGEVLFEERNVASLSGAELRKFRQGIQAVFQDPYSAFNPRMRIRDTVSEPLMVNGVSKEEAYRRAAEVIESVGLDVNALQLFPHEFSGGQRQRIAIARALAGDPKLIVLDEPVTSLDVSIRGQVINLLNDVRDRSGVSYLLISHDLATTRYLSDRIYVMYSGQVVETGSADQVFENPMHPYTKALLAAARSQPDDGIRIVDGEPPNPRNPPSGCRFHPRCPVAMAGCVTRVPSVADREGQSVGCHLYTNELTQEEQRPLVRQLPIELSEELTI